MRAMVTYQAVNVVLLKHDLSSVTPKCIASGLVLIVAGLIGLVLEAPCCFVFFDFGDKLARWSEERKPWHKVVLFVGNSKI